MSEAKKPENSGANTRWWESYLVRYFSGAVVGAICLATILMYADSKIDGSLHFSLPKIDGNFPISAVALALISGGLVYSYIISSPITVVHFGRSGRSALEQHVRYLWLGWVVALLSLQLMLMFGIEPASRSVLAVTVLLEITCIFYLIFENFLKLKMARSRGFLPVSRKTKRKREACKNGLRSIAFGVFLLSSVIITGHLFNFQDRSIMLSLLVFSLPALFVGFMQYATLFRIFSTEMALHRFYRLLSRARSMENSKDIRETYTHLREHSNSTFIVLLELCFSAFLLFLVDLYAGGAKTGGSEIKIESIANAVLFLVAFWMVPNLFMWSRANQLERDFSKRPMLYASTKKPTEKS